MRWHVQNPTLYFLSKYIYILANFTFKFFNRVRLNGLVKRIYWIIDVSYIHYNIIIPPSHINIPLWLLWQCLTILLGQTVLYSHLGHMNPPSTLLSNTSLWPLIITRTWFWWYLETCNLYSFLVLNVLTHSWQLNIGKKRIIQKLRLHSLFYLLADPPKYRILTSSILNDFDTSFNVEFFPDHEYVIRTQIHSVWWVKIYNPNPATSWRSICIWTPNTNPSKKSKQTMVSRGFLVFQLRQPRNKGRIDYLPWYVYLYI